MILARLGRTRLASFALLLIFTCFNEGRNSFPLNHWESGDFKTARRIWLCSFEWAFSNLQRLAIRVVNPLYDLLLPVLCSEAAKLIMGVNGQSAPVYPCRQLLMLSLFRLLSDKNALLVKNKSRRFSCQFALGSGFCAWGFISLLTSHGWL